MGGRESIIGGGSGVNRIQHVLSLLDVMDMNGSLYNEVSYTDSTPTTPSITYIYHSYRNDNYISN